MFTLDITKRLEKKSTKAVGIIQSTITNLEKANKEVRIARSKSYVEQAKLKSKIGKLDGIEKKNENFIKNFSKLFND